MRAELRRASARIGRAGRRQLGSRRRRLRSGRKAPSGHVWIRWKLLPVLARLDPGLQLPKQRAGLVKEVVEALGARRIQHWWIPPETGDRATLGVREEDRAAVLEVLATVSGPAWHADLIRPDGRARRLLTGPELGSRGATAPGLLLWEFVAAEVGNTFIADDAQGLEITFFSPDPERADVLRSAAASVVATELPVEQCGGFGEVPAVLRRRQITAVGFPIDVVYTWVDGADEAWLRSKAEAAGVADPEAFTERAHDAARFADHDELRYSLRSLQQFAPWVNHVWVVTADQSPAWLRPDDPWVTVVPHREIWPDDEGLPTFNSHAIEACLHRIPGLSEHFLYLNDDMILGRTQAPERFFHPSGIGKFFNSRALVGYGVAQPGEIASTTAAKNARTLLAESRDVTFARKFYHTAVALRRSVCEELETEFADVVATTRAARFRTVRDVALSGSFYLNYAYLIGAAVPSRMRYDYVDPAAPDAGWRQNRLLRTRAFDAFCINDGTTAETEEQQRRTDQAIRRFLRAYLPVPGTFEIPSPD